MGNAQANADLMKDVVTTSTAANDIAVADAALTDGVTAAAQTDYDAAIAVYAAASTALADVSATATAADIEALQLAKVKAATAVGTTNVI